MRATKIHVDEAKKGSMSKQPVQRADSDDTDDRAETIESRFEATLGLRESLSTPVLFPDGSLKKRVGALEQAMEMQVRRDDVTYQNIIALSKDGLDSQEKLKVSMKEETSQIREQMAAFQLEVRHRFELQSAENKRLSQHVTSLKQENRQLQTDLVMALEKLRQLELELSEDPGGGANEE